MVNQSAMRVSASSVMLTPPYGRPHDWCSIAEGNPDRTRREVAIYWRLSQTQQPLPRLIATGPDGNERGIRSPMTMLPGHPPVSQASDVR